MKAWDPDSNLVVQLNSRSQGTKEKDHQSGSHEKNNLLCHKDRISNELTPVVLAC